jgi:hypothetical protein
VTLLEILFAFGFFLVITFGAFTIFSVSSRADKNVWESTFVQASASKVVQGFVDELRTANYSTIGGYPLRVATGTEIVFFANIDSDSLMERVRYFVSGTTFMKGISKPSGDSLYSYNTSTEEFSELLYNLETPLENIFTYYGESYDGATNTSSMSYPVMLPYIRVIEIKLKIKQNNLTDAPVFEIQSKAQLRNLKAN